MSESRVSRATAGAWWGVVGNAVLAAGKAFAGWWTDSEALVWDAARSVSDAIGCVAVLVGLNAFGRAAGSCVSRGFGGASGATAVAVSVLPMFVGWEVVFGAFRSFGRGDFDLALWPAAVTAVLAAAAKEAMVRWTPATDVDGRAGRRERAALFVVLAGISGTAAGAHTGLGVFAFSEPVAGAALGGIMLWNGFRVAAGAVRATAGFSARGRRLRELKEAAELVPGVLAVSALDVRLCGRYAVASLRIGVDPGLTVRESHAIAKAVQTLLLARFPDMAVVDVAVLPYARVHERAEPAAQGREGMSAPDCAAEPFSACRRPTLH